MLRLRNPSKKLRFCDLKDGMYVSGSITDYSTSRIHHARIQVKIDQNITTVYLLDPKKLLRELGWIYKGGAWFRNYSINLHCVRNPILNLIKDNSLSNKLLSVLHLNKDQRKLSKAGVYDSNGNLTTDGQELVLNLLAKEYEEKLVELVEPLLKKKKDCDDDKED
jgi:hypothetical protein